MADEKINPINRWLYGHVPGELDDQGRLKWHRKRSEQLEAMKREINFAAQMNDERIRHLEAAIQRKSIE